MRYKIYNVIPTIEFLMSILVLISIMSGCTSQRVVPISNEPNLSPVKLLIAPENSTVKAGEIKQFSVNYVDWNGNYHKPNGVEWTVSAGRISGDGSFLAPDVSGPVVVRAKYMGVSANTEIIVLPSDKVAEAYIVPDSLEVEVGSKLPLTLVAKNSEGMNLNVRASWKCKIGYIEIQDDINKSPVKRTATGTLDLKEKIYNYRSSIVYYAPIHTGNDIISAELSDGRIVQTSLKIVPGPAEHISLLPRWANVPIGSTEVFVARVYDRYTNLITDRVEWFAQNGHIDKNGKYTPNENGGGDIVVARYLNVTAQASVNNASLGVPVRIEIIPSNIEVRLNDTIQFTAVGYDEFGNQIPLTSPIWSVDNGYINNFGMYDTYYAAVGPATIKVTQNGVVGETTVTVVAY